MNRDLKRRVDRLHDRIEERPIDHEELHAAMGHVLYGEPLDIPVSEQAMEYARQIRDADMQAAALIIDEPDP